MYGIPRGTFYNHQPKHTPNVMNTALLKAVCITKSKIISFCKSTKAFIWKTSRTFLTSALNRNYNKTWILIYPANIFGWYLRWWGTIFLFRRLIFKERQFLIFAFPWLICRFLARTWGILKYSMSRLVINNKERARSSTPLISEVSIV